MTRIELAKQFGREAHDSIHQVRKYGGEPYWIHPEAVAADVQANSPFTDPSVREDQTIAALLHDVEEDVAPFKKIIPQSERFGMFPNSLYYYDIAAIVAIFGARVGGYVLDVTDQFTREAHPTWNRARRKAAELERLKVIQPESKTIKLADFRDNTKSIVADDPDFAVVYLREKAALLPFLKDGGTILWEAVYKQLQESQAIIGLDKCR